MNKEMQTSVKHTTYLRHIIDIARGIIPTIDGKNVPKNDFFVNAAAEKAIELIKRSPGHNYEAIKEAWEKQHGAVYDYDEYGEEVVENGDGEEEDELLKELAES